MFRSLFWKELRGAWLFGLAALLAQAVVAWDFLSHVERATGNLFRRGDTEVAVNLLAFGFAIALGLWQAIPEMVVGTAPFLVQTARSRPKIVAAKIAAGAAWFAAVVALPFAAMAGRAIAKTESFYDWSDTRLLWLFIAMAFVAYLGVLAVFLRGYPWREAPRQIAGAGAILLGILLALLPSSFPGGLAVLAVTAAYAVAWAISGFEARGF